MIFWYQQSNGKWLPRKASQKPVYDPKEMRRFRSEFHGLKSDETDLPLEILARIYPEPKGTQ